MTTVREQILSRIATTLASTPSIGAPVFRSRTTPISRGMSPAVIVEPVQDQARQVTIPKLDWMLMVRVSIIVRGEIPDQAGDSLAESVHAKIMSDLTVGGYAYDVQPQGVTWDLLETDLPGAIISCDYAILYRTSLTDLTEV